MTVLLILSNLGAETGPFDLYSNLDVFTTPFMINVSKIDLEAGYLVDTPDYTTVIRVKSTGVCTNYADIVLTDPPPTTTTTTTVAPPAGLDIDSSRIDQGEGTVDITGGEPNEIIYLHFTISLPSEGTGSASFDSPITVGILDPLHIERDGYMQLDINGEGHAPYSFNPRNSDTSCQIEITNRSSGLTYGIGFGTNVI